MDHIYRIAVTVVARNASDTIAEAMESVVTQDYDDFQVIFFNDGSTDRTAEIAAQFATRCNLILAGTAVHCGKAEAQARAFRLCRSEYVIACDADDRMLPGALKSLVCEADRTGADMIMAPMMMVCNGKRKLLRLHPHLRSLEDMAVDTPHFSLCNKLLRTDWVLRHCMPYPGIDRWEDLGVVARYMALDPTIAQLENPVYEYVRRPHRQTLTSADKETVMADRMAMTCRLEQWLRERNLDVRYAGFIAHIKFHARIKLVRGPRRRFRQWLRTYPEINPRLMKLRHVPLPVRLLCCFLRIIVP